MWKRHAGFSKDGTWDRVLQALPVKADHAGHLDWQLSIDSTVSRVHQHGLNMSREVVSQLPSHTGDVLNYKRQPVEPVDHVIGRSRGSLTTKLHTLVEGNGRPLVPPLIHNRPAFQQTRRSAALITHAVRIRTTADSQDQDDGTQLHPACASTPGCDSGGKPHRGIREMTPERMPLNVGMLILA